MPTSTLGQPALSCDRLDGRFQAMRAFPKIGLAAVAFVCAYGSARAHDADARSRLPLHERQLAQSTSCSEDLPFEFVDGVYSLIGKRPGGGTYTGALRLSTQKDCTFRMVRCIGANRLEGSARFDFATADKIPVLRTSFPGGGRAFEGRFKIDGDFDNQPVLTGPYRAKDDASSPWGWEFAYVDPKDRPSCD